MGETKKCNKCGAEHAWKQRGHGTLCRECWNAYHREWSHRNRPKIAERGRRYYHKLRAEKLGTLRRYQRAANLKRYGVTQEWYEQKLREQGGGCAICGNPEKARNQYGPIVRLSIDHNHDDGTIRGLLCFRCNASLHRVEYIPGWTQKATDYLKLYD